MKRLKVLALCAVLAGLGGAVSALTAAQESELRDFLVKSGQYSEEDVEDMWGYLSEAAKDSMWEEYQSSNGGSGLGFDLSELGGVSLPSLTDLKGEFAYTPLVAPASQSGLVSEVDDYMDVNSWQSVQFDKLFTHVGYNIDNQFNAGLATRLGKVYVGGFFYGNFIDSTTSTIKMKEGGVKAKITNTVTNFHSVASSGSGSGESSDGEDESGYYAQEDNVDQDVFQLSTLIGIGNLGIKPSVLFAPKPGNSTSKMTDDGNSLTTTRNAYEIYPQIEVGYNLSIDSLVLTPHAYLGFDFDLDKTTTKYDGKTVEGNSKTWTMLGLGTGIELPGKDGSIVTNSFSMDLDFAFRSKEKLFYDDSTKTLDESFTLGAFTLGWTGKFVPADNVSFKLASTLPIEWGVYKFGTKTEDKYSATDIAPTFTASVKYQASEKLALGLSADLGLPTLEFASAGAGDNKMSSVRFNTEDHLKLEFDAGFRFDFTQNVTLDCGWSFGGNLFNNYFKTVSDSDNGYTFWGGLSYIFSDIQMGLSVKL